MPEILQCTKCKEYTLKPKCSCGGKALSPKPAKWSQEDKYAEYRLKYKVENAK
jgi:H/ACA ribonucleoprotein complex subunit 3